MDCLGRVEYGPIGGDAEIQLEQLVIEGPAMPHEGDNAEHGNENHRRVEEVMDRG